MSHRFRQRVFCILLATSSLPVGVFVAVLLAMEIGTIKPVDSDEEGRGSRKGDAVALVCGTAVTAALCWASLSGYRKSRRAPNT